MGLPSPKEHTADPHRLRAGRRGGRRLRDRRVVAELPLDPAPLLGRAILTTAPNGEVIGVQSQEVLLSVSGACLVLGVWVVVLTAVALLVFRARDVT